MSPRDPSPARPDGRGRGAEDRQNLRAQLRRAWLGYQLRVDEALVAEGFGPRVIPDARVLRICARADGATAAQIGRELHISRQGAGKIVAGLRERGFVTVDTSPGDGREKVVSLTPRAVAYLGAQRTAVRRVERELRDELGPEPIAALESLLDALGGRDQPTLAEYLRDATRYLDDEP